MEIVNPPTMARPVGYNNGIKATGAFLAVAGQVAWDKDSKIVSDDFVKQFAQALQNVVDVVQAGGGKPENIVRLVIFIASKDEYNASLKAIGSEYRRIMGKHFPAMTCLQVAGFVEAGAKIEIEAFAVI